LPPIIDIHIHINPHEMVNAPALELIKRGRRDYDEVERYAASPAAFLKFMDSAEIERAGLRVVSEEFELPMIGPHVVMERTTPSHPRGALGCGRATPSHRH